MESSNFRHTISECSSTLSRSLMGSSNQPRSRLGQGLAPLAIPHGEFERHPFDWREKGPRARDPSWGVRTSHNRPEIPTTASRDPSWGVRTLMTLAVWACCESSRSLMGSSNADRPMAASALAISRSLMGSSNEARLASGVTIDAGSRSLMGSSNRLLRSLWAAFDDLAIPHGEFERGRFDATPITGRCSRSLMGSSNPAAPVAVPARVISELAIPHGEFELAVLREKSANRISRSLMGSSNAPSRLEILPLTSARDPSWGVRTPPAVLTPRLALVSRSLMGSSNRRPVWPLWHGTPARDPSWGVRTKAKGDDKSKADNSRSLMGSSNFPPIAKTFAIQSLAIPHGEFEPAIGGRGVYTCTARDPSWGVRTKITPQTCSTCLVSRSLMGSSNSLATRSIWRRRRSRSLMGSSNKRADVHGSSAGGLAIPHGEFEPKSASAVTQENSTSRSLMGSSNPPIDVAALPVVEVSRSLMGSSNRGDVHIALNRSGTRDPSWGVRTPWPRRGRPPAGRSRDPSWGVRTSLRCEPVSTRSTLRSLMGSSNVGKHQPRDPSWGVRTQALGRRHAIRQARDPSWGVRTRRAVRALRWQWRLAIPHGEFERSFSVRGAKSRRPRDPSWGVRTWQLDAQGCVQTISRSLMGSSNL